MSLLMELRISCYVGHYDSHVGVYIGCRYVVDARGFDYGVCITKLSARLWTHWHRHPRIKYTQTALSAPDPAQINGTTGRYSIVWLQLALNRQLAAGCIQGAELTVDGVYGIKTVKMVAKYWQRKGWLEESEVWSVGRGTVKALGKGG